MRAFKSRNKKSSSNCDCGLSALTSLTEVNHDFLLKIHYQSSVCVCGDDNGGGPTPYRRKNVLLLIRFSYCFYSPSSQC